ncbi:MAG: ClcB-like voltage-gated chloride channel protein [Verrucomicrobiota bacterium]
MEPYLDRGQDFVRRHWKAILVIRERVRFSEETFHLALAGVVGVIGGFTNLIFYNAILLMQMIIFGEGGDPVAIAELIPWWQRFLIPALGGLLAGGILYAGLRLIGNQGSTNFLEVVVAGDGRLPFRTALVRGLSSLMSIATGASIGREGAITQLTAMLASKWGQIAKWQPYRLRLLVACGAASGLAAAYNAPVAGAVFAAQIVLGNFSMNLFAPLVFSSVIASMLSRNFFGINPWYSMPGFEFTRISQLPWFLLLGVLAGGLGVVFMKMLRAAEEKFLPFSLPLYVRLAIGGALVGLIAIGYPQVWGNGYSVAGKILHNNFEIKLLLGIFLAKLLATVLSIGSGAVGGVFTPTLFLGAALGALFGKTLYWLGLGGQLPIGVFALVGMGSMLAATTRSPLLAMIMIFEMSLNYSLMPALMLASVVSTLVARRFHPESIYTEPLRQKGFALESETARAGTATEQTVGDLMRAPVLPVNETATLREIANRFLTSANNFLPVVDAQNRLLGIVALQDLKEHLSGGEELNAIIAYDVMRPPPPCLTPNQRLLDALPVLLATEQRNVPVVNTFKENRLVGAIVRAEALGLLSEAIAASGMTTKSSEPQVAKEAPAILPVPTETK